MVAGSSAPPRDQHRLLVLAAAADLYGSDRVLLHVLEGLRPAWDITVVFPARGPLIEVVAQLGCRCITTADFALRRKHLRPVGLARWLIACARGCALASRLHREQPFDLLLSNTLAVPLGPAIRRRLRIPHIWHVHEMIQSPRWLPRMLARLLAVGSDRIVCNSQAVRDYLVGLHPTIDALAVIEPNPVEIPLVDVGRVTPAPRMRIGCVARVHPGKGHDLLLRALQIAVKAGVEAEVRFYGDPYPGNEGLLDELQVRVVELGLEDRVLFLGFQQRIESIYPGLDMLVVPSTVPEGFSMAAVEAMSFGIPVIVPREGGPLDIVTDGEDGLVVPPRNPRAIADAIVHLAGHPEERKRMGSKGRAQVAERFSVESFQAHFNALCEDLIETCDETGPVRDRARPE